MIVLTIDADWAPDAVIADTLDLLEAFGAPATIFATNRSAVLDGLDRGRHEIGVHPNYMPLLNGAGGDPDRPLLDILEVYPESRGIRTHGLVQSARLHDAWARAGLVYESHQYLPWQVPLFTDFGGLVRVPVYWGDGREIYLPHPLEADRLAYDPALPAVIALHFVHIFLNSETGARYAAAKPDYHDPARLRTHRNTTGIPGVRDFLTGLLRRGKAEGWTFGRACDAVAAHQARHGETPASVWTGADRP